MARADLLITLMEPLALSANAATTGGHNALDRIPGSVILGLAASKLHNQSGFDAWNAFYSGAVRFGDAYPYSGAKIAFPVARCLHREKTGQDLRNFSKDERAQGVQYKQLRSGYLTPDGQALSVEMTSGLRTAIDEQTGSAKTAALFQMSAVQAGQQFIASLEWDESMASVANEILDVIAPKSHGNIHRIGKSRTAEFGAVKIERTGAKKSLESEKLDGQAIVWLLSDLEIEPGSVDVTVPNALGFQNAELIGDKSFVHYKRFAPFNNYWRTNAPEKLVIGAGSVCVLRTQEEYQTGEMRIGKSRHSGFGHIWVNPPILTGNSVAISDEIETKAARTALMPMPNLPIFSFMEKRKVELAKVAEASHHAEKFVEDILNAYASARQFNGLSKTDAIGPTTTQWKTVEKKCQDYPFDLETALLDTDNEIANENDPVWGQSIAPGQTFSSTLKAMIGELNKSDQTRNITAAIIQRVARQMANQISNGEATS